MSLFDEGIELLLKFDPDCERSFQLSQVVAANLNCYKELYLKMKNKHWTNIGQVFCWMMDWIVWIVK